jgi:hypothetical protein
MIERRILLPALLLAVLLPLAGCDLKANPTAAPAWAKDATRTNEGAIMFSLTPVGVKDGRFEVKVSVNTHSGDLASLDLQATTVLRVAGKDYRAVAPVPLDGHHTVGRLLFPLGQLPERFEIVIRNVGTLGDLTFRWP